MNQPTKVFEDKTGLERIMFFSDAVMAIAITLLVIELRVPEIVRELVNTQLLSALLKLWPRIVSYILSFAIISNYWLYHHRTFRNIRRYDYHLIMLNLIYLFFVALLPFSTRLLGFYPYTRLAIVIYSINVFPLGVVMFEILRYAYVGNRLIDESIMSAEIQLLIRFTRRGATVFIFCIILSIIFPKVTFILWLLAFIGRSFLRRWMKVD
jgi:TMEM175 potassium channel family protein